MKPETKNKKRRGWRGACLRALGALAVVAAAVAIARSNRAVRTPLICAVRAGAFQEKLQVVGEVQSGGYQEVRAPAAPYQRQITWLTPEGESVKKGDILAQFDVEEAQGHLEEEEDRVDALGNLLETETIKWEIDLTVEGVRKDQKDETRQVALRRKEGSVLLPELPREIGERKFGVAHLSFEEAARRIEQLEKIKKIELRRRQKHIVYRETRVARDEAYIEGYVVRAPVDSVAIYPPIPLGNGVIRKVEPGDYLSRGQVFMTLPDFSTRVIRLQIPEREIQKVSQDAALTFVARAFPGRVYQAEVLSVSNLASENTNRPQQKFFEVVARIVPGEGVDDLKPGMVVAAEFHVRDYGVVFAIPKDLALPDENGGFVLRLRDERGGVETVTLKEGVTETDDHLLVPPEVVRSENMSARVLRVMYD